VALCTAALVFLVWYPSPLAGATGVTNIFLIVLAVDVTVGPVITLIVFNTAKKELKRDLMVVVVLQVVALLYGMQTVFEARPVYAVFNADRFDLVYANDLSAEKLAKVSRPEFKTAPLLGPKLIAAQRPSDTKARNEVMFNAISGGDDVPQLPQYYVPYSEEQPQALARIQSIDVLRSLNKDHAQQIDELSTRYAGQAAGIGFLPLRGRVKDLAVIVTRDKAEVLEIADLKPWL
jgi:hypothetical protein